jgi:hypothetical protein
MNAQTSSMPAPSQRERLVAAARRLARRPDSASGERWLLLGGAVVLPFGLICILLGYWGAAHTSRVIQQIPYEISGGIFGLALVFAGGFAYFAWWLTGLVREQQRLADRVDRQTTELTQVMSRIEVLLAATAEAAPSRPSRANGRISSGGTATDLTRQLVTTPNGSLVHRPDCPVVANREDTRRASAGKSGLKPCRICSPDLAPAAS